MAGSNSLEDLYEKLISSEVLRSNLVKKAFLNNDRKNFMPERYSEYAYKDVPLPIGRGQTISQPTTVIFMLELLGARSGNTILDIGAGSGWVTAMLAYIVGEGGRVYASEIKKPVADFGRENLKSYNYENIKFYNKDYQTLLDKLPPLDRIISGAGFREGCKDLISKLKVGGKMVIPTSENDIRLIKKKSKKEIEEKRFPGFIFVPIIH